MILKRQLATAMRVTGHFPICYPCQGYAVGVSRHKTMTTAPNVGRNTEVIALTDHPLEGHRDGDTFDPASDLKPLNKQQIRVFWVMAMNEWMSVDDIAHATGDPGASVSARIRDFRKDKFGSHRVERKRLGRLWVYKLWWNEKYPEPTQEQVDAAFGF